jgi:hypothetical protein
MELVLFGVVGSNLIWFSTICLGRFSRLSFVWFVLVCFSLFWFVLVCCHLFGLVLVGFALFSLFGLFCTVFVSGLILFSLFLF